MKYKRWVKRLKIKNNKNIKYDYTLTIDYLQLLMKYLGKYLNISSDLIKLLIKNNEISLLDIIFSNLKFYYVHLFIYYYYLILFLVI